MTAQSLRRDASWSSRPLLSAGVRVLAYGTPVGVGTLVVHLVSPSLMSSLPRVAGVILSLLIAVIVSLTVSRLTMRLMPLAVLLRMTMLFPDRAPSRLKVARRATSMREITALLSSPDLTESDAAATMLALVTALGRHDRHTRGHSERVRLFCDLLSRQLDLPAEVAGRLRWAALIHDIGKLEVAATILNKPGTLDPKEWQAIKRHPEAGARLAAPLAGWLGPWFNGIAEHHERYDGSGYPAGLAGTEISVAGRAVAVVDAFETMTASRSYKAARSTLSARSELTRCAGTHFDPMMVRAFLQIALPRLLWSVGPLAFLVNVPFLRWVGEGGARLADVANATTATATTAASVTAVAVAVTAFPAAPATAAHPSHTVVQLDARHTKTKDHPKATHKATATTTHAKAKPKTASTPTTTRTAGPAPASGTTRSTGSGGGATSSGGTASGSGGGNSTSSGSGSATSSGSGSSSGDSGGSGDSGSSSGGSTSTTGGSTSTAGGSSSTTSHRGRHHGTGSGGSSGSGDSLSTLLNTVCSLPINICQQLGHDH